MSLTEVWSAEPGRSRVCTPPLVLSIFSKDQIKIQRKKIPNTRGAGPHSLLTLLLTALDPPAAALLALYSTPPSSSPPSLGRGPTTTLSLPHRSGHATSHRNSHLFIGALTFSLLLFFLSVLILLLHPPISPPHFPLTEAIFGGAQFGRRLPTPNPYPLYISPFTRSGL